MSSFVDITHWPRGELSRKSMHSFVGSKLSFLKLGSRLVGLSQLAKLLFLRSSCCFEVLACIYIARLEVKWSLDKSICKVFTCRVCVN